MKDSERVLEEMTVKCMTEMRVGYVLGKSLLDRSTKKFLPLVQVKA